MTDLQTRLVNANPADVDVAGGPSFDAVWERFVSQTPPPRRGLRPVLLRAFSRRHRIRLVMLGAAGVAAACVLLVVGATGTGPTSAFARWTPRPTHPAFGQLESGEAECASNPSLASLTPTLSDTRGPFSLFVYAEPTTTSLCLSGVPSTPANANTQPTVIVSGPTSTTPVSAAAIQPGGAFTQAARLDGTGTLFETGRVGADVTGVTLTLNDGSSVQATVENGWYAAWWPSLQGVQSAELTTSTGTITQTLNQPNLQPPQALGESPQGSNP
jgi:hypothetical protein